MTCSDWRSIVNYCTHMFMFILHLVPNIYILLNFQLSNLMKYKSHLASRQKRDLWFILRGVGSREGSEWPHLAHARPRIRVRGQVTPAPWHNPGHNMRLRARQTPGTVRGGHPFLTHSWHVPNPLRLVIKFIAMSTKSGSETEKLMSVDEELKLFYKGAFDDFDWNKNGRIACGVIISTWDNNSFV